MRRAQLHSRGLPERILTAGGRDVNAIVTVRPPTSQARARRAPTAAGARKSSSWLLWDSMDNRSTIVQARTATAAAID